ncbi:MAG: glycosyl hydrolase family 28 protein [Kiritimatiellia bacterium]
MNPESSVPDHGVVPDGSRPCGEALNSLFASGPAAWFFPAGCYEIETTLRLPSGTRLHLDPGAVLRLADGAATGPDDYLLTNADPVEGNRDLVIEGGILDGNQRGNPRPPGLMDVGYSGAMLHFDNVNNLRLSGLTLRNAEAYYARFTRVHDFTVEDILFDSDLIRPNNDGIHLGGNCSRGLIRRLRSEIPGVTGDDMVALNADDALDRTEVHGMTRGPIEHIRIESVHAQRCHSFVRLLSVTSPIRHITISDLRGGCERAVMNADGARGCRVQVFDENDPPYPGEGVGWLEDIHVSDARVHKTQDDGMALIDLQERVADFQVSDFVRDRALDRAPGSPTLRFRHMHLHGGELNGEALPRRNTLAPNAVYEAAADSVTLMANPKDL